GAASGWLVAVVGPAARLDAGALAAVRTAALVAVALLCAGLGHGRRRLELVWATYVALGAAALKILVQDVPNGRPATLFLALGLFGGALIVAPRLVRRRAGEAGGGAAPS
ncbi:MAG TPA: hypothetical protein VGQ83_37670, partial [Polyangia bacterium]